MSATLLVILFVVGVLASVAWHELGHFATARWCKMAVSDFSVGFGKPLATVRYRGIAYRLRLLPLGGFVRIHGMRPSDPLPDHPNGERFVDRPAWQRALVAGAGPAANLVLAWALLTVVGLSLTFPHLTAEVARDTGALRAGDQVAAVDGIEVRSGPALATELQQATGPVEVLAIRSGERLTTTVGSPSALHAELAANPTRLSVLESSSAAGVLLGQLAQQQVASLAEALAPANLAGQLQAGFSGEQRQGDGVMSIVGLGGVIAQLGTDGGAENASHHPAITLLFLLAALNLVLALVNLLPVTPLDGGHVALAGIEGAGTRVRQLAGSSGAWFLPRPIVRSVTYSTLGLFVGLGATLITLDIVNPVRLVG